MDVVSVLRPVTKCITDTTRNVVLHQLAVKSHKKARIISCEDLKRCQEGATLRIPELLDALEENHTPLLRYRFYGYFAAFTASITIIARGYSVTSGFARSKRPQRRTSLGMRVL
ncbi:hypothetical protein EPR50_G00164850 [Perca flavescens]|uniref:Uncharacterized protein n=1 Tax=Perca flavescens TaxID=8167 RepID=A0A484CJF6_PERFV|nr:hypothetical protein EPR50_G00164850 [Perca flavescens]